jgi:hypothetical protein
MLKGREKAEPGDGSTLRKVLRRVTFVIRQLSPPVIRLVNGFRDEDYR